MLYLLQERAERLGTRSWRRLPAADDLDRLADQIHAFVFLLWTFAVIAGAIGAENAWGQLVRLGPQRDLGVHHLRALRRVPARATAGWKGRRAAAIAVVAFSTFLFNYFVINLVVTGKHLYAGT